ncbi:ANTAR domain-containing protein [uncultured Mycobacterium sp.]|uniref:ANTAR domain-containing protein n=1 Tax=uncultured Mycobacterium sp. TaxID=171292 RepID=UPI0035CA3C9F
MHVAGDLDETTAPQLSAAVAELLVSRRPELMVLDVTEIGLVTTAGVDIRAAIHDDTTNAVEVRIVARGGALRSLRTGGLSYDIAVYPTVAAGLPSSAGSEDVGQLREIAQLREQLVQREQQLESLRVIEEAKGMLMQDFNLNSDQAFGVLKRLSQETNVKLRELGAHIVSGLAGVVSEATAEASYATITALRDQLRQRFDADGQPGAAPPPRQQQWPA